MIAADPLTIRPLGVEDLDEVASIERLASAQPWSRNLFAGELDLPEDERIWIVGEVGGSVVGFAGIMLVGDDIHVMNIATHPDRRRQGTARRLLAETLRLGVAAGGRHATLEVRESNEPAIALYRRFRLGPVGIRGEYYEDGEDALILWAHDIDSSEYQVLLRRLATVDGRR